MTVGLISPVSGLKPGLWISVPRMLNRHSGNLVLDGILETSTKFDNKHLWVCITSIGEKGFCIE